jgi:hypothetical protein
MLMQLLVQRMQTAGMPCMWQPDMHVHCMQGATQV